MPLWSVQAIIAIFAVMSLICGIWLLLNMRAVARTFRGTADLQPGPGPRGPSRKAVWTVFVLFNLGWIASLAFWTWARDDDAPQVIDEKYAAIGAEPHASAVTSSASLSRIGGA